MKIVIAVLALTPTFAHALTYFPQPNPPCVLDDCIPKNPKPRPLPCPKPCPRPWDCGSTGYDALGDLRAKTSGLAAAIADGKMDKAGESLNGLFAGAGSKEKGSETAAVTAGAWTVEPRAEAGLSKFRVASPRSRMPLLVEREDGNHEAKMIPVGAGQVVGRIIVDKVIDKVIEKANDAATKYVERDQTKESIEKYGGCRMKGTCPK